MICRMVAPPQHPSDEPTGGRGIRAAGRPIVLWRSTEPTGSRTGSVATICRDTSGGGDEKLVSRIFASWNLVSSLLARLDGLRRAA
jgi:hypothetical protein